MLICVTNTKLIFETGSLSARFLGSQRQGPSILVQPQELYSMCIHVGLLPRPVSVASVNPSLGLTYNMMCSTGWATGEYDYQGCTLKFVLDWAWETVSKLKHKIDQVCVPLFNWSGLTLDRPAVRSLVQCGQKLAHLICILKTFASGTGSITVAGEAELNSKVLHLAVVLWFFGTGLLPENDGDSRRPSHGGARQYSCVCRNYPQYGNTGLDACAHLIVQDLPMQSAQVNQGQNFRFRLFLAHLSTTCS
ncbi:hypothetical protein DPMN_126795 [Dreissena polymorpha]|uniref:Uncharacterized protein n=1 Tax=Dreissena polymorpha TaxID=45954 RepID=A0A9D4GXQ5_DREPO|nr:hypothetical protein DPMN_126795 [Dreissena polymorpha]